MCLSLHAIHDRRDCKPSVCAQQDTALSPVLSFNSCTALRPSSSTQQYSNVNSAPTLLHQCGKLQTRTIAASYNCGQALLCQNFRNPIPYSLVRCIMCIHQDRGVPLHIQWSGFTPQVELAGLVVQLGHAPPVTTATVSGRHHFSPGSSKALLDAIRKGNQLAKDAKDVVVSTLRREVKPSVLPTARTEAQVLNFAFGSDATERKVSCVATVVTQYTLPEHVCMREAPQTGVITLP